MDGIFNTIVVLLFVVLVLLMLSLINIHNLEREAIEKGYAIHCPETGDWNWIEDCRNEVEKK